MFRDMRRKNQLLTGKECAQILNNGTSGVLAVLGDDQYPYAVPLSYVYDGSSIYFHCAKSGHKLDAIQNSGKASFCVVDQDDVIPEEYTTYFRSVIVFGNVRILEEKNEKRRAIEKLAVKYHPNDSEAGRQKAIDREYQPLCMLSLTIEHMTGKESIELARRGNDRSK